MTRSFILLCLIALFTTTAYSQTFLGIPTQVQTTSAPVQDGTFDELLFENNEEEMSFEEGEFSNEEGEFSNEEGEFALGEEEMILVDIINDEIPSIPALSNMTDDDMLADMWIGVSEEEMSFEEGELLYGSEEECYFEEYWVNEEEAALENNGEEISSGLAFSDVVGDEMIAEPWIGVSEEEMNFEGEFTNEEGEFALEETEFSNDEVMFGSDSGFNF